MVSLTDARYVCGLDIIPTPRSLGGWQTAEPAQASVCVWGGRLGGVTSSPAFRFPQRAEISALIAPRREETQFALCLVPCVLNTWLRAVAQATHFTWQRTQWGFAEVSVDPKIWP